MALELVTAAATTPITLAEAKAHLRVDIADDDTLITNLISVATEYLDGRDGTLGRALITQTWDLWLDCFPANNAAIQIPLPPLQSITTVAYTDENGAGQTLTEGVDFVVDNKRHPGWILPAIDTSWPATELSPNVLQIRFVAGYGAATTDIPEPIRQSMLLLIGHYYENREEVTHMSPKVLPLAADHLLAPYRLACF